MAISVDKQPRSTECTRPSFGNLQWGGEKRKWRIPVEVVTHKQQKVSYDLPHTLIFLEMSDNAFSFDLLCNRVLFYIVILNQGVF